jgi:poly-gamma-glutamate synthesis protein (capsule biosynthesis protein)
MIANIETTFAGAQKGYSAYPRFNTPDALAEAVKYAGIDVVSTTNNHLFDNGLPAMFRTLDVLRGQGIKTLGTHKDSTEKNYEIIQIKGVKVGFAAYTYESGKKDGLKTINGLVVPKSKGNLINSYDPYDSTEDLPKLKATVDAMKADSAKFIVFIMHWGVEYESMPNENQLLIAKHLNSCGVDVIFGSHPHVVQPIDFIKNDSTGQLTFVAYSMGNFISNQRYETMKNYSTEDGLLTGIVVKKEPNKKPELEAVFYEPTWVHRYENNGRFNYLVLPVNKTLDAPESFEVKEDATHSRILKSSERTNNLIRHPMHENSSAFFERYLIDFDQVKKYMH